MKEDLDFFLFEIVINIMLSFIYGPKYLQFGPHTRKHAPEYFHTNLEDLRHRTESVTAKTQAEILLCRVDERRRLIRGRREYD